MYDNCNTADVFQFGPFHRAHVMDDYFSTHNNLTFEDIRDLAIYVSATDSFALGGNPWKAVKPYFSAAISTNPTEARLAAIDLLNSWHGRMVDGNQAEITTNMVLADAWTLQDEWIREVLRLTFYDELATETMSGDSHDPSVLFGALLHGLENDPSGITNQYDWFQNTTPNAPSTAEAVIVTALDNVLTKLGSRPWNKPRAEISYIHDFFGLLGTTPFAHRSTYGQCVEMDRRGPIRIETLFPLGESGTILGDFTNGPIFDDNFFSMKPLYDSFTHKPFQLFYRFNRGTQLKKQ